MKVIKIGLFSLVFSLSTLGFSQDLSNNHKLWYGNYLYYRLNPKLYLDNFLLLGFEAKGHSFSFLQNDFNVNLKLTKDLYIFTGFANYVYDWNQSYNGVYGNKISRFGTISFFRGNLGLKYKNSFGKRIEMGHVLSFQTYIPTLEKYQSRIMYSNQISYKNENWDMELTPFVQGTVYYYLNGVGTSYYNNEGNFVGFYSPNGLHRMRTKIGVKFKPFNTSKVTIALYYSMQREFNFPTFGGHDLEITRNVPITERQNTVYPFNNYNIIGTQININISTPKKKKFSFGNKKK